MTVGFQKPPGSVQYLAVKHCLESELCSVQWEGWSCSHPHGSSEIQLPQLQLSSCEVMGRGNGPGSANIHAKRPLRNSHHEVRENRITQVS